MKKQNKKCLICKKVFYKSVNHSQKSWNDKTKYCSRKCMYIAMKEVFKDRKITWGDKISKAKIGHLVSKKTRIKIGLASIGRKHTGEWKNNLREKMTGENSPVWKGGKPKCIKCGKQLSNYKIKFCLDCYIKSLPHNGKKNSHWKGGIMYNRGYKFILLSNHINADKKGYIAEHRLIASNILGRPLEKHEVIHHIDGIKNNNEPENLYLFTKRQHDKFHKKPYSLISNLI